MKLIDPLDRLVKAVYVGERRAAIAKITGNARSGSWNPEWK
jgi:hypothetical protein